MSEWGKWSPDEYTFPGMKKWLETSSWSHNIPLHQSTQLSLPLPYLDGEAGAVSTHPAELKTEDRNDMARGNGLEWGLALLQQSSQVDAGQRNTKRARETDANKLSQGF